MGETALVAVAEACSVGVAEGAGAALRAAHAAAAAAAVKCADKRAAVEAAPVTSEAVPGVSTTVPTVPKVQSACKAPSLLRATAAKTEMLMTLQADAPGMDMFRLDSIAPPQTRSKLVKAAAPTTKKAICGVIAVDATVVTAVITKVVVTAVRVGDEMESASVLVVVLLLEQLLVLHGVALVMTMLQFHAMVPPLVSAKVATAATPKMTMALRGIIAVGLVVGTMVITTVVIRALTMSAEAGSVFGLVVVVLLMLSLHLNVVAPMEAMLLSLAMVPPRTIAKVVMGAATSITTAPREMVVMSAAEAPSVAKTGVLAVLRVDTKVEGASVLVLVLVGLLVELFVMVAMMTILEIHALVSPPILAEVMTAVATSITTAPGEVVVMSAAVAPPGAKTGVLAVLRVDTKVEGASVLILVLMGLLVVLFVMVAMMTMLKIHALVSPPIFAKVAMEAATTMTMDLGQVVVVSTAVAPAVAKTGVLATLRVRARVEGASVIVLVLVGLLMWQFALAPVVVLLE